MLAGKNIMGGNPITENGKDEPVLSNLSGSDVLGGTGSGTRSDSGSSADTAGSPATPNATATGTTGTQQHGDIPARPAGGDSGSGELPANGGTLGSANEAPGSGESPKPATRRGRKPRTSETAETPVNLQLEGIAEETKQETPKPSPVSPVSINLGSARARKAKPITLKPEVVADVLVLGFGALENSRGPHWKRSKAECTPFAKALTEVVPDLPPEILKTIEKVSPYAALVFTGAMLLGPGLIAEYNISKFLEQEKRSKNRVKTTQPTQASQPATNTDTTDRDRSASAGSGSVPSGSGEGDPSDSGSTSSINTGVAAFGKLGNPVPGWDQNTE